MINSSRSIGQNTRPNMVKTLWSRSTHYGKFKYPSQGISNTQNAIVGVVIKHDSSEV